MKQLNPNLVIIDPALALDDSDLVEQLVLQVKIYGSKIVELY